MHPMTDADLRHLQDISAPISEAERLQAAAEIVRLRMELRAVIKTIQAPTGPTNAG